jgi:hypothetical protein
VGLYLCIFDTADEEIDGVEVGTYADFGEFRDFVTREIEAGKAGARYPTLIRHSDSDGEWSVDDCEALRRELGDLATALKARPPIEFVSEWQRGVAKQIGLKPQNAFESFVDVDGEFLIERLQSLVETGLKHRLPILFQ